MNAAIGEIVCQSILTRCKIPGIDYTINPFTGCLHGCAYCYARFMARHTKHHKPWGTFCDIKINAPEVLKRQLPKAKKGLVSLSSVTDPYLFIEESVGLTRSLLKELAAHQFPVSILTKSPLVLRDLDILKQFDHEDCDVGFSVCTMDEDIRRTFEPGAPPVADRIEALRTLHRHGIRTWIFLAPFLPYLTERTIFNLLDQIQGAADYILVDMLNIKCGNWPGIREALNKMDVSLVPKWEAVLTSRVAKESHCYQIFKTIASECDIRNLPVMFC